MSLYYAPEKVGLRVHKSHDRIASYEYDQVTVFADDAAGEYLIGHSSGCSCSAAFDGQTRADLTPVRTLADVAAFARAQEYWTETDVADLLTGLRLDGYPAVVDGSLIGAEPAAVPRPAPVKDLVYYFNRGQAKRVRLTPPAPAPVDAEPALPAPRQEMPAPAGNGPHEADPAVVREAIVAALMQCDVTPEQRAEIARLTAAAATADTFEARREAGERIVVMIEDLLRTAPRLDDVPDTHEARPCGACGRDDSECVAGMRELGLACCMACAMHVTHESV